MKDYYRNGRQKFYQNRIVPCGPAFISTLEPQIFNRSQYVTFVSTVLMMPAPGVSVLVLSVTRYRVSVMLPCSTPGRPVSST